MRCASPLPPRSPRPRRAYSNLTRTVCMYALMDAFSPLAFVFFWLIVIFGGF